MVGKFGTSMDVRGDTSGKDHNYLLMCTCPLGGGSPSETMMRMWNGRGITVDGELAYPAEPYLEYVVVGICVCCNC